MDGCSTKSTTRKNSLLLVDVDDDEEDDYHSQSSDVSHTRETCCDLARSAMHYTAPTLSERERIFGRQLLSEAVEQRRIPGLGDKESPCTVQDCLTSYYLSEANRHLGRENSRHYYLQEALTLVESLVLKGQGSMAAKNDNSLRQYESAKVDARMILAEWTSESMEAMSASEM